MLRSSPWEKADLIKGLDLTFSALLNFFFSEADALLRPREVFLGLPLILSLSWRRDVGSQSDVVEPPALAKSKQKAVLSNLRGKLSFSLTVATGSCLSLLLKERESSLLSLV